MAEATCDILIDQPSNNPNPNSNVLPEDQTPGRQYDCQTGPRFHRERIREQIADFCLLMLGAPVITVELDKQQVSLAVNECLKMFELYAPAEQFAWLHIPLVAHQSVYQMPCDVGYIREVSIMPPSCDGASELGGSMPLGWIGDTGYGAGGLAWGAWGYNRNQPYWGYGSEWVLFKSYEETFDRLSSRNGGWEYYEDLHSIKVYPTPSGGGGHASVHYMQKKKDFKEVHIWMQNYALALCKTMLGRIRSKYSSYLGPNSEGISLDGQNLIEEGKTEVTQLLKDMIYTWNEPVPIIMG